MKKHVLFFTFCFVLVGLKAQAQDKCDRIVKEAENILYNRIEYTDKSRLLPLLKPCVIKGDLRAENILGLAYLNGIGVNKDKKKGYNYINNAAQKGYNVAQYNLGKLYKYGTGCELNFVKAIRWFKKAAKNNNQKAAYSLGYMYYKGFGVKQNYRKAVNWFKVSSDPMAKHFLGMCYYFGYGVSQNKHKAVSLLKANSTINSKTFLKYVNKNEKIQSIEKSNKINLEKLNNISNHDVLDTLTIRGLKGAWTGNLLQYDWSGNNILRAIPISINFNKKLNNTLKISTSIDDKFFNVNAKFNENNIYIEDDLTFTLNKLYSCNPYKNSLDYTLLSLSLNKIEIDGNIYLTGFVDTYIDSWSEHGKPMRLLLEPEKNSRVNELVDEKIITALSTQKNQFIKLYPVPFKNQLTVQYHLEKDSKVYVEMVSLVGGEKIIVLPETYQKKGEYTYNIAIKRNLAQGLYVVRVVTGNKLYTRMIIKSKN